MRTIWHSLAWKEWHEHKWKLASIVVIMGGVMSLAISQEDTDPFGLALGVVTLSILPLSVFVGLGAAANERSRSTIAFLQSLPVPVWRVAMLKLLFGLLTVIVPLMLTIVLFLVLGQLLSPRVVLHEAPLFRTGNPYVSNLLLLCLLAGSLFIWSAAAGVDCKDEIRAGAIALAVMIGWSGLMVLLVRLANEMGYLQGALRAAAVVGLSTAPMGPALLDMMSHSEYERFMRTTFCVAGITHLFLIAGFIRRYGQVTIRDVRSPQTALRTAGSHDWLAPPRSSPSTAVAWKQFRESGPIALVGIAGAIGITLATVFVDRSLAGRWRIGELIAEVYPQMAVFLGIFVALVLGIGISFADSQPQLNTFWRSRPINPDLWFWSKLLTGLTVLLSSIYAPIYFLAAAGNPVFAEWNSPDALVFLALQVGVFAAAAMTTCLVRHAIYAAILSIAVVYLGVVMVWAAGMLVRREFHGISEMTEGQAAAGMIIVSIAATFFAWLAMRFDWGWKSRY